MSVTIEEVETVAYNEFAEGGRMEKVVFGWWCPPWISLKGEAGLRNDVYDSLPEGHKIRTPVKEGDLHMLTDLDRRIKFREYGLLGHEDLSAAIRNTAGNGPGNFGIVCSIASWGEISRSVVANSNLLSESYVSRHRYVVRLFKLTKPTRAAALVMANEGRYHDAALIVFDEFLALERREARISKLASRIRVAAEKDVANAIARQEALS